MKTLLISIMMFVVSIAFAAQGKVVTVKGDATVQKGGSGSFVKLTRGYTIQDKDMVKLGSGASITFAGEDGVPVEMNKSGQYSGSKLFASTKKKGSASKKFGKFLMNELSETDDLLAGGDSKGNMGTLGAVERALPTGNDYKFDVVFPKNSFLVAPTVNLVWNTVPKAKTYTIHLKDNNGYEVKTIDVKGENSAEIDLDAINPVTGECYFWSVSTDNGKSTDDYCLLLTDLETLSSVQSEIESVDAEYSPENPVNSYIKARLYEDNNMMIEADKHYKKAVELSDNDERFVVIYNSYLDRATK